MLEKDKSRANRMMKSLSARLKRKSKKRIVEERTNNLYLRLRKLRKKAS